MSGDGQGRHVRRRPNGSAIRRASIACTACRTRRMRCDGDSKRNVPCTYCKMTDIACHYPSDDGRKSSRVDVAKLQERIAALERDRLSHRAPSPSRSLVPVRRTPWPPSRSLPNRSSTPAVVDGLKSAFVFLNDRGQVRFYGYTSNIPLAGPIPPLVLESPPPPPPEIPTPTPSSLLPAEGLADASDLQAHLVELYFTYQDPALPMVQRDLFLAGWARGTRGSSFSSFLLNTILARASRMSDRPDAALAMPIYQRRARAYILDELDDPVVATIQALCIYGQFLTSLGNETACWLYSGMAFRLAFDLGLHQDCAQLAKDGQMAEEDQQNRVSVMWSCYILDKIYSTCQGRPSAIRIEDLNVPGPSKESVGARHQLLAGFVEISSILDAMSNILNRPELLEQEAALQSLVETTEKLLSWLQTLPEELRWPFDTPPSPGICALHMHALAAMVLIHRPFAGYKNMNAESIAQKTPLPQLPGYTCTASRAICAQNSMRLAKMLDIFRQTYGITKIFSMGTWFAQTAGMTLTLEVDAPREPTVDKTKAKKAMDVCEEALRDLSESLPLARKHRGVMLSLSQSPQHERTTQANVTPSAQNTSSAPSAQSHPRRETSGLSEKQLSTEGRTDGTWLWPQLGEVPQLYAGYQNNLFLPFGFAPNYIASNMFPTGEPGFVQPTASAVGMCLDPGMGTISSASQPFMEATSYQPVAGAGLGENHDTDFDLSSWSLPDFTDL